VQRLAAGQLLALLGDPRIRTLAPSMIRIPGGGVRIGLAPERVASVVAQYSALGIHAEWIAKECPEHEVALEDYGLAKYPVTNIEFQEFLLATSFPEIPSSWAFRRFPTERANHPVYSLSAEAADAYACWLAGQTGRRFRLPTEAEWEYAAAGAAGLEFPWGDEFRPDHCNTAECGLFATSPIGAFPEGNSPFGLSDMAGNVEEYVSDRYGPYPGGEYVSDYLAEVTGGYRVARGGGFARFRDLARTRRRHGPNPLSTTYTMGFRLAETL
ncbi:MAG: formylglycine-generating enzyme family protein, partial [Cyanobacteria bacterium REEB65]|nr:formylglycine-generating enzyme family protein [Cyanobacteria bacterium REEB65]